MSIVSDNPVKPAERRSRTHRQDCDELHTGRGSPCNQNGLARTRIPLELPPARSEPTSAFRGFTLVNRTPAKLDSRLEITLADPHTPAALSAKPPTTLAQLREWVDLLKDAPPNATIRVVPVRDQHALKAEWSED